MYFLWTSIELFSAFCRHFFNEVVKAAFYVSIATFWKKNAGSFQMLGRKPSAFCDKLINRVVKTAFQVYMGISWAEKLSDENLTFSCSDIERRIFTFVWKFFDWVVRTAFHLAKKLFWEEVSSLSFPLSFSDLEQKFFGVLSNVYQLGCQNCIFRVQKCSLRWTSFARKLYSFVYHFRTFRQKNLLSGRKITPFVKSAFWLSIGTIWGEVFYGNLFWSLLEI